MLRHCLELTWFVVLLIASYLLLRHVDLTGPRARSCPCKECKCPCARE